MSRSKQLFYEAMEFAKHGGFIDITAKDSANALPLITLQELLKENNVSLSRMTLSSDGGGRWSTYDKQACCRR